jgi:murein L,D-transpeptidase YcbB/YkuD
LPDSGTRLDLPVATGLTIGRRIAPLLHEPVTRTPTIVAISFTLLGCSGAVFSQEPAAAIRAAIAASLVSDPNPALGVLTRAEQVELTRLYERDGYLPLWIDGGGRPGHDAHDAMTLLSRAADEGLDPADYHERPLQHLKAALERESPQRFRSLASFDVVLSSAMLRYLQDVHRGRVDPRTIGLRLNVPADPHDFAAYLRSAVVDRRLIEAVSQMRPPLAQYGALRGMLTRYRVLAAGSTLEALPSIDAPVRPGGRYAGRGILQRRLVALGDLAAETLASGGLATYEGALVEGVKRFQARHSLESDGILGKRTLEILSVPLSRRIRQIELALERLRWLPHLGDQRLIAINIPMFRLWAWDSIPPSGVPSFGMDVIVGRALNTQTPVFVEQLQEVVFRPYWNIPRSITLHEILPSIERDPDYLRRQDMEIVRGPGDDARMVAGTAENIGLLRQGALRVRQRPGSRNALGLVKFVFPNEENVYMHGTPAQALFSRSRRDFSHGCVRVEDPAALAAWALADRREWTRDRIDAAMTGSQSVRVRLVRPIQVILFYTTAAVMPEDGSIHFAEDIYLHDARLDRALTRQHPGE